MIQYHSRYCILESRRIPLPCSKIKGLQMIPRDKGPLMIPLLKSSNIKTSKPNCKYCSFQASQGGLSSVLYSLLMSLRVECSRSSRISQPLQPRTSCLSQHFKFHHMKLALPMLRPRGWMPASDPWSGVALDSSDTIPLRNDLVIGPRPLEKAEKVLLFEQNIIRTDECG